ncbi:hypothetical protein [Streptomyces sp. MK5]|nr:hypothetical protein [Streptomyces sp. MK5]
MRGAVERKADAALLELLEELGKGASAEGETKRRNASKGEGSTGTNL